MRCSRPGGLGAWYDTVSAWTGVPVDVLKSASAKVIEEEIAPKVRAVAQKEGAAALQKGQALIDEGKALAQQGKADAEAGARAGATQVMVVGGIVILGLWLLLRR
jgi:hypothetical protein